MLFPRIAAIAVALVTLGCSDRASTSGGGATGGTLVVVTPGAGSSPMIPPLAIDIMGRFIADNVYERLAEIGPDLNSVGDAGFTPRLARRWEWAADSLSIAFVLDPRAKWHDGRPVTASDVRYSVRLLKDPKTGTSYTSLIENIDSVSVRDSLTAVVWFHKRTPEQFYDFAYQVFVLPEHVLKDVPADKLATSEAATHPIGSNQFRFARFEPGVRVELVADTTHYRGRPKLDRVIVSFVADPGTAITQLVNGQADFYENIPIVALARVDSAPSVKLVPYSGLQFIFLGMNQRDPKRISAQHPIFADRRVRLAVSMGVDRQAMLRNVFDTLGLIGVGPFSRKLADTTVTLPPFDRARAAALLDSAGWRAGADGIRTKGGKPLAFGILVPTSSAARMRYAVLLQDQLKSIGVRADIESIDISAFIDRLGRGNFDAVLNGLNSDPARSSLRQVWTPAAFPPVGQNFVRYSNPTVTALVDSASATFDRARMNQYYHRAFQTLVDDAPAVWLYDVPLVAGVHNRIHMEGMRADNWWAGLPQWWIPADERIDRDRIGLRPAAQN